MTYKELKKIGQAHIRKNENLPSNSFLLLAQLHIPFKTEKQCQEDYKSKMSPLYNTPAFLALDKTGEKIMYFNSQSTYWNFYIFHEISHYLLGHEDDCIQNEDDANMLACILAAPIENLPSTLKSARDLSGLCKIPIDKAEVYWQEIKYELLKQNKKKYIVGLTAIIAALLFTIIGINIYIQNNSVNADNSTSNITPSYDNQNTQIISDNSLFYITPFGTHYHKQECQYIKSKTNVISVSAGETKQLNLEPCEKCIE